MAQDIQPVASKADTIALGKAEYFVELCTPHSWSGGPRVLTFNPKTGGEFTSLAEAAAYAEAEHNPTWSEDSVNATYGVRYVTVLDTRPTWFRERQAREEAQRQAALES